MYVLILLFLLIPSLGHGAISCGDVTPFNNTTPADPETISYVTPTGSNQVLFAGVVSRRTVSNITGATHAGNTMTAVEAESFLNPIATRLFYIVNPTSGTNNVVVDFVGAALADSIVIWTCSGVDTASPIRAFASATGTGTAVTVTVSGVQTGDVVLDIFGTDVATTNPTIGANQTNLNTGNDGAELGWGASQQPGSDGGVMSWTTSLSQEWSISAVAIKPLANSTRHIAPLVIQ